MLPFGSEGLEMLQRTVRGKYRYYTLGFTWVTDADASPARLQLAPIASLQCGVQHAFLGGLARAQPCNDAAFLHHQQARAHRKEFGDLG